jgi:hypothetical protein
VLPNPDHGPPGNAETLIGISVSLLICANLLAPELGVVFGPGGVFGASVPEATVDEHRDAGSSEDDVGSASFAGQHRLVDSVSKSTSV